VAAAIRAVSEPRTFTVDSLLVRVFASDADLATAAAVEASETIRAAVRAAGRATVMFASGDSQLPFLEGLAQQPDVPWSSVVAFHMDEYLGMPSSHPASFRRYMHQRVVAPLRPAEFHDLDGDARDPEAEADRYAGLLREHPLDLCCLGMGENGHLAFNDPEVADFHDPLDVKVVELDDRSRRQQVGEGHFPSLAAVSRRAITVTIPALLRARHVLAIVPEVRKAQPVRDALDGPVAEACPASILRRHAHAILLLDEPSASLLAPR